MPTDRPLPLFREALAGGNLSQALRLAKMIPDMTLSDAARLLALMGSEEDTQPDLYERACIRWLARFVSERKTVTLQQAATAVEALDQLDEDPGALNSLLSLVARA